MNFPASGFTTFLTPDGKNVNPDGTARVTIGSDAALFFVDSTSMLNIVKQ